MSKAKAIGRCVFLSASLLLTPFAYAEVPVVNGYDSDNTQASNSEVIVTDQADGGTTNTTAADNTSTKSAMPSNSALPIKERVTILERQVANLNQALGQVNQLQSQIQDLRGEVEVEKHTIKVLQDQVRSQYQDLDQRVTAQAKSALAKPTVAAKPTPVTANKSPTDNAGATDATKTDKTNDDTSASTANNETTSTTDNISASTSQTDNTNTAEQKNYQSAIDLLKNKKYAQATAAFQKYLKQYPNGQQTSNARFWLGQLFLLQGEPDKALDQFKIVLKKDPTNKKTPDILLQVGLAYYAKGDMTKAQSAFKRVIQKYPTSAAAKLAQARLKVIQQANADQPATTDTSVSANT